MDLRKPLGIIQSRGLGDLVIALPIAHYYYTEQNRSIYWPICKEFLPSMINAAPWVNWIPITTDPQGHYFAQEPIKQLEKLGITEQDTLWLYQYLSSHPEKTNPDWFAMMKFDQYKYAVAGIPFRHKWNLKNCIKRNISREQDLYTKLIKNPRYWVIHQHASDIDYEINTSAIDPECQIVEITEQTDNIWDWLQILENCEGMILIDSVFANIVDQMDLNPRADRYYMRKWNRNVDGNPVFMNEWTYLEVDTPRGYEFRSVNPREEARKLGREYKSN